MRDSHQGLCIDGFRSMGRYGPSIGVFVLVCQKVSSTFFLLLPGNIVALTTSFTTENGDDQNTKCKWAEAILASERRIHTIAYDTIQVFETSN